jgi:prepilin-type N-terminal cleavage/methylation domain-containing protein
MQRANGGTRFTDRIQYESGYSLVEVMVAIMILSIAIIPMVGMFDAGLRASVVGSNYDKGRALASEELAEIQAIPFASPDPAASGTANSVVEIYLPNGDLNGTGANCTPPVPSGFDCKVKATYVRYDAPTAKYIGDPAVRTMIQATVTAKWDNNAKSYSTTGLVSKGTE